MTLGTLCSPVRFLHVTPPSEVLLLALEHAKTRATCGANRAVFGIRDHISPVSIQFREAVEIHTLITRDVKSTPPKHQLIQQ